MARVKYFVPSAFLTVGLIDSQRKSNKIQQCIKILFHMKLNMFRATHRPSSGA
jgi:hypothetical protein